MLIRKAQIDTLNEASSKAFEDEMVTHLADFSPPLVKAIQEAQLRVAIRLGIERARSYGFVCRGPLRFYLELTLLFGSYFDTDPQYPWAGWILTQSSGPEMQRAELLYERTREYRQKVAGPQDEYTLKALRNVSLLARGTLAVSADNFAPGMLKEMARVYPEKSSYIGENQLTALIQEGTATAQRYGFSSVRALALPTVLMFAFGHGCFADPLYPWIAKTAHDQAIVDAEARAKRLEHKALTWLDHVLAYFGEDGRT